MEETNEKLDFNSFTSVLGKPEGALANLDKLITFDNEEDKDLIVALLYKAYTEGIEFMNIKMETHIKKLKELQDETMRSE